jgi:probable F420-dependent oxidoreductase
VPGEAAVLERQGVRLGLITPIATQLPRAHAGWEADAGIDEMLRIAVAADRLGFDHLTCSEHIAVPTADAEVRGATYWDPLATFGCLAGATARIRLATYVLVLGYHHPLEIAKRYGTLDRVSGGRLVLGLGVGTLEREFELLGAPFADRGDRADDALRALRASLGRREVEHHGPHYDFADLVVEPHALNPHVPFWIGGRTQRSLRRAVELADGWAPFWLSLAQVAAWLGRRDLPAGFEVVVQPPGVVDPLGDPSGVDAVLADWRDAGATVVDLHLVHRSLDHYLEQLEALAS